MTLKTQSLGALFVALIIILAVNPRIINNIYGSILGRLALICIVIFFTMNNTTLGLLVALAIITSLNQFGSFVEGMANSDINDGKDINQDTTIGDDNNSSTPATIPVLTKSASAASASVPLTNNKKISELKSMTTDTDDTSGPDILSLQSAIMPKASNSMPVLSNKNSNDNVSASSENILNKSEGFSSYGSVY
jgi:hypothetical protein